MWCAWQLLFCPLCFVYSALLCCWCSVVFSSLLWQVIIVWLSFWCVWACFFMKNIFIWFEFFSVIFIVRIFSVCVHARACMWNSLVPPFCLSPKTFQAHNNSRNKPIKQARFSKIKQFYLHGVFPNDDSQFYQQNLRVKVYLCAIQTSKHSNLSAQTEYYLQTSLYKHQNIPGPLYDFDNISCPKIVAKYLTTLNI